MTTQRPPRSFLCLSCAAAATASSLQTSKHSTAGRWLQNAQHQDGQTQRQHILSGGRARTAHQNQIHHWVIKVPQGCWCCWTHGNCAGVLLPVTPLPKVTLTEALVSPRAGARPAQGPGDISFPQARLPSPPKQTPRSSQMEKICKCCGFINALGTRWLINIS